MQIEQLLGRSGITKQSIQHLVQTKKLVNRYIFCLDVCGYFFIARLSFMYLKD